MKNNSYNFMRKQILLLTIIFAITAFCFYASVSLAQYTYTPMEKIPGTTESISAFPDYIKAIYKFALWSVGIAALLMVSIGGFMYFSAAGNTSKLDKAKIVIRDSIFGITAVLAAYLLLYTINPDLVGVSLSGLSNLGNSASASVSFQSASPSQGTINSNFTTHINITGNGSYTLESLSISGIDEGSYTSSLNNNTISITVPNPQLGIYQITAIIQDQDNNSHTSENINFRIISDASQLAITNLGLNEGTVGSNYSQVIQAEGGSHNYTISVSGLPTGLTFHSNNNTITGTPTQAETFQITITVNDANDGTNTIEKEFSLNVREGDYPVPPESCVSVCQDGDTKCTSSNPEISKVQYCEKHHTCWVWGSPQDCPNGQKCRNNSCGGGGGGTFTPPAGVHVTELSSPEYYRNIHLNPREIRYYHFRAGVSEEGESISVKTGSSSYVHMLLQLGGEELPDMGDYERTKDLPPKVNGNGEEPELFWDRGGSEEITIRELMNPQDFYVMLYNDGDEEVHQGLRIDWDY